jgi:hypothetical protein
MSAGGPSGRFWSGLAQALGANNRRHRGWTVRAADGDDVKVPLKTVNQSKLLQF